jgi:hypothetical protein
MKVLTELKQKNQDLEADVAKFKKREEILQQIKLLKMKVNFLS